MNYELSAYSVPLHKRYLESSPLQITGHPGTGKTTYALLLLNECQNTIVDSGYLKQGKEIQTLLDNLTKRNISEMFATKREYRGLLLDDIHTFYREDMKSFQIFLGLCQNVPPKTKIVITYLKSYEMKKKFLSLKYPKIDLSTSVSERYKLVKHFAKMKIKSEDCDRIVYETKGNLHEMREILAIPESSSDKREGSTLKDIITIKTYDHNTRTLDFLETIPDILKYRERHRSLSKILQMYVFSDIYETFLNREHLWNYQKYVYEIRYKTLQSYVNPQLSVPSKGNRYISKSLTHISAINQSADVYECIHPIIYSQIYQNLQKGQDSSELFQTLALPQRYRKLVLKTVAHFYKIKIPAKLLL